MAAWVGPAAAAAWFLTCLRCFDAAAPWRPGWLEAVPVGVLGLATLALAGVWAHRHRHALAPPLESGLVAFGLVLVLTVAFRMPLVRWASVGYTPADGAVAGLMALHVAEHGERPVFIPKEPYSGSLKAYIAAPLVRRFDASRAYAFVSVLFYTAFVGAVFLLAERAGGPRAALGAGFLAAFSPTFITQYSLSNDGNYAEVLALGTWALLLLVLWLEREKSRAALSLAAGVLLGLAFWCHILAIAHVMTVALVMLAVARRRVVRSWAALGAGLALGYLPGLIWNAANGWLSFSYLMPRQHWEALKPQSEAARGLGERLYLIATDHAPVLFGYDPGYPVPLDRLIWGLASGSALLFVVAVVATSRRAWREGPGANAVLLAYLAANVFIATVALPHVDANPRYLLFSFAVVAVLLPQLLASGRRRPVLVALCVFGAAGSLGQGFTNMRTDARWRTFTEALEAAGVEHCYTDFHIASRLNFLSRERIRCSSKLGPTSLEYYDYESGVNRADAAALVAVNPTNGDKLARKLTRLGVGFERLDLMKPVLIPERLVRPDELFPQRASAGVPAPAIR